MCLDCMMAAEELCDDSQDPEADPLLQVPIENEGKAILMGQIQAKDASRVVGIRRKRDCHSRSLLHLQRGRKDLRLGAELATIYLDAEDSHRTGVCLKGHG